MNPSIAIIRSPSVLLSQCELTHMEREPLEFPKLLEQYANYIETLKHFKCTLHFLPELANNPDGVFVEDTALVLPELAVVTHPGAESRRGEVASVQAALGYFKEVIHAIKAPGTMEGGDILKIEKDIFVGLSTRTNQAGIAQLRLVLKPYGYSVHELPVVQCLHLKTGVSYLGNNQLLINPEWVNPESFPGLVKIAIDPTEPFAANVLAFGNQVVIAASAPKTAAKLRQSGLDVLSLDISELAKAEAGLTCLGLIFS